MILSSKSSPRTSGKNSKRKMPWFELLRHFFIPGQHNDFKPKALHPKRLLFYSCSAAAVKILVVISVLALPATAWLTPDVLQEQGQKIIKLTNEIRQEYKVNILQENKNLDLAAYDKAQDMLVNQYFSHISPTNKKMIDFLAGVNYGYAAAGENLAMGFSSAEQVIAAWTKSQTHWQNLIDPDYKEIGVAAVSGPFKGGETTLVAQFFATPKIIFENQKYSQPLPITVDLKKTKVYISQPQYKKEKIIKTNAYFSGQVKSASVKIDDNIIALSPETNNSSQWTGSLVVPDNVYKKIANPVVLASLSAEDFAGNKISEDIDWEGISIFKPSLSQQYLFIKNNTGKNAPVFQVSNFYFAFLLIISIIALALNIFIEIKKQHPHIIASALGLIGLLLFLLYF
jgi:uncharacterized protein YkwD